ncbi:MAG TPA: Maf family protein [Afifellaceae bacterium]|nr:Maf family protein [Afifellaceae bacterium]
MALILASASPTRERLLRQTGLRFVVEPAELDERAAERPLVETGADAHDVAMALAMTKAGIISERSGVDLVIGADQTLEVEGERLNKPADMEAARRQLLRLRGRTHELNTAVCCARGGEIVWQHMTVTRLTMRQFSPEFLGRYLAQVGPSALESVGAYQIEGAGIQLFEAIDGDYFAILGLPLLPLLAYLRAEGALEE